MSCTPPIHSGFELFTGPVRFKPNHLTRALIMCADSLLRQRFSAQSVLVERTQHLPGPERSLPHHKFVPFVCVGVCRVVPARERETALPIRRARAVRARAADESQ